MHLVQVPVADITLRAGESEPRNLDTLPELVASIRELGLLNPITIATDNRLVAGRRRLAACKELGWETIPAVQIAFQELQAELASIDENICRAELTVLGRSEQLTRRKDIYEALHPEAKAHSSQKQRQRRSQEPGEIISPGFSADTAAKTGVSPRTVQQEVQIATAIPEDVKEQIRETPLANSKTDLLVLARMPQERQRQLAAPIAEGRATNVRQAQRVLGQERQQQAAISLPPGVYNVILADPPWDYSNSGFQGAAAQHYPTIPTDAICLLPVADRIATDSVLFLWATNPLLQDALRVIAAWGFAYKTNFVWVKGRPTYGKLGFYNYGEHELLLVAVRGSFLPVEGSLQSSVIAEPKRDHSRKPDVAYQIIEQMYPNARRVELFARGERPGWVAWGNEVDEWP